MAKFHEIESSKGSYKIISIECPQDNLGNDNEEATYRFMKVMSSNGRTSRVIISVDDINNYTTDAVIELYSWSMNIIPVKVPNRNLPGEYRVVRSVSGLSFDRDRCDADALRSAQRLYDTAEFIADNAEARALARKNMLFVNFVDRTQFLAGLSDED